METLYDFYAYQECKNSLACSSIVRLSEYETQLTEDIQEYLKTIDENSYGWHTIPEDYITDEINKENFIYHIKRKNNFLEHTLDYLEELVNAHNVDVSIITDYESQYTKHAEIYLSETLDKYRHKSNHGCYTLVENRIWIGFYYNAIEAIIIDDRLTEEEFRYEEEEYIIEKLQQYEKWSMEDRHKEELEDLKECYEYNEG